MKRDLNIGVSAGWLVLGLLLLSAPGCPPHPGPPPVNPPGPVIVDASVPEVAPAPTCYLPTAVEDRVVGAIVNAFQQPTQAAKDSAMERVVATEGEPVVRCALDDLLLDVRGAPNLVAAIKKWKGAHP